MSRVPKSQVDQLMIQSKRITADLGALREEIASLLPGVTLDRASEVVEQRLFLLDQKSYKFREDLSALGKSLRARAEAR